MIRNIISILIFTINNEYTSAFTKNTDIFNDFAKINGPTPSFLVNALWNNTKLHGDTDQQQFDQCIKDIKQFKEGVQSNEEWALKMLDSSAHLQSGFLEGNIVNLGNFEECININNQDNGIQGKHCRLALYPRTQGKRKYSDIYKDMIMAVCIPDSCTEEMVKTMLTKPLKSVPGFDPECKTKSETVIKLVMSQWLIMVFFVAVAILLLFGTIYDAFIKDSDFYKKLYKGNISPLLMSFSICLNGENVLKKDKNKNTITCLHGLRFISACGIIIVHRNLRDQQPFTNLFAVDKEITKWYNTLIVNAYLFVDVFFLMSGLVISYSFLKRKNEEECFHPFYSFVHRYVRLTPPLVVAIMLSQFLNVLCSGYHCYQPVVTFEQDLCKENWPYTLLYITNLIDVDKKCLPHSWYLTADMQLFVISFILILFMAKLRNPKYMLFILIILLIMSLSAVFGISYKYQIPSVPIAPNSKITKEAKYVYEPFYTRAGPWLIGFGLGILINDYQRNPIKMSKFSVAIGWILSKICITAASLGMYPFLQDNYINIQFTEYVYKSMYRSVWALGFAWIIYACYTGHGGFVNRVLSSHVFHPLSRLSYCIYLIHPLIQILQIGEKIYPRRFSHSSQITVYVGDIFFSILAGLVLHLAIEAPTACLEKLFKKNKEKFELQRMYSNQTEVDSLD